MANWESRSQILTAVRDFFLRRDYVELDTPLLSSSVIPESTIEIFETRFYDPVSGEHSMYLLPSPELWMKCAIAQLQSSVFQVSKCFRNAEFYDRLHNPEFTMLEYYTINSSTQDAISITESLVDACAQKTTPRSALLPFEVRSMADAFAEYAGLDLEHLQEAGALAEAGTQLGLLMPQDGDWEGCFNAIFLSRVEPALPKSRPVVLTDYPAQIECLAQCKTGTPWRDRWELYINGIELANCYSEERDIAKIRDYFITQSAKKATSRVPGATDFSLVDTLAKLPPCSGVAIGFERLVMTLSGIDSMDELLRFPFSAILPKKSK